MSTHLSPPVLPVSSVDSAAVFFLRRPATRFAVSAIWPRTLPERAFFAFWVLLDDAAGVSVVVGWGAAPCAAPGREGRNVVKTSCNRMTRGVLTSLCARRAPSRATREH